MLSPTNEWTLKSPAKVNIEHILPLNLSAAWRDALGQDSVEIHAENVDRWGNLTLLSEKNQQVSAGQPFRCQARDLQPDPLARTFR